MAMAMDAAVADPNPRMNQREFLCRSTSGGRGGFGVGVSSIWVKGTEFGVFSGLLKESEEGRDDGNG